MNVRGIISSLFNYIIPRFGGKCQEFIQTFFHAATISMNRERSFLFS
ncbi:uncharacterized protein METZ01_LOCUS412525, partial [marine metagenome]